MVHTQSSRTVIPVEIYLSIFDYVVPPPPTQTEHRAILTNICLVCRAFCWILQPRIFRSLELTNKKANKLIPTEGSQAFCVAVINGVASATSLAQHVTECTLRDWTITSTFHVASGAPACLWEAYRRTLGLLPNLRVLNMLDMCLDEMMLRDICSLKGLRSLLLQNCITARGIKLDIIRTLRPLRSLQYFYFKGKIIMADSLYLDILRQIIDPTHLKAFHSTSWNVTTVIFTDFAGCSSLLELNLYQAVHNHLLQKILTQSPLLKSLTIGDIVPSVLPPNLLSTSCIPDLESLVCPPSILSDLVPGRPLRKLIISGISYSPNTDAMRGQLLSFSGSAGMKILAQSSARIHTLRVPLQIFIGGVASRHFSSLEQLHLDFYHENYDFQGMTMTCKEEFEVTIRDMCRETPPVPSLRALTISFGSRAPVFWSFLVDLVLQHRLVTLYLTLLFPDISVITFSTLVRWNKVINEPKGKENDDLCHVERMGSGRSMETGSWSAEVLPGHHMVLTALGARLGRF